jgi:putative sterol carrier protein
MAQVQSVKEYFDTLGSRFQAQAARGVHAIFQFELAGSGGGTFAVKIDDGAFTVTPAADSSPTVTLKMDAEQYIKMVNGKINGHWAVLSGKLKVAGDMVMAVKMQSIFPPEKS